MTDRTASASSQPIERVRISCPGGGRNDYVAWRKGQPTFPWKCFNCGKKFELTRSGGH
jgi:hypothetical protein